MLRQREMREDFTEVCEIISVIEKANWWGLFVLSPDTKPKDHKMKRGGSGSWRGNSSSLTLLSSSLQNVVDAISLLEFGIAQDKFTKKDPLRNIKYEDTASDWGSSWVTNRWGLGEYLRDNQHMAYLLYFYRLTKACGIGWMDWLFPPHVRTGTNKAQKGKSQNSGLLRSDCEICVGDVPW